jgi:hypothetical protein
MGQTLLVGYAYDNFDIDFKSNLPTVERNASLAHMMSGTLICLEHGVTTEHLKCSEELWSHSPVNPLMDTQQLAPA